MSEDFSKKIGQLMKLSFELIDCSKTKKETNDK